MDVLDIEYLIRKSVTHYFEIVIKSAAFFYLKDKTLWNMKETAEGYRASVSRVEIRKNLKFYVIESVLFNYCFISGL